MSSVSGRVLWAGRVVTFLGVGHTIASLVLTAAHTRDWFTGELWLPDGTIGQPSPVVGAFWMSIGSFGVPLVLVGLMISWLARRGVVPPAYVAWTLAVWGTVAAVVFEPAPWVLLWIPAGLLLTARREPASGLGRGQKPLAR